MKKISKKELVKVHQNEGLNGLYAYLRRNGIEFEKSVKEFGLNGSKKSVTAKQNWLSEKTDNKTLRFHYYGIGVKARKTGFNYNILRGIEISLK